MTGRDVVAYGTVYRFNGEEAAVAVEVNGIEYLGAMPVFWLERVGISPGDTFRVLHCGEGEAAYLDLRTLEKVPPRSVTDEELACIQKEADELWEGGLAIRNPQEDA